MKNQGARSVSKLFIPRGVNKERVCIAENYTQDSNGVWHVKYAVVEKLQEPEVIHTTRGDITTTLRRLSPICPSMAEALIFINSLSNG